MFTYVYDNFVTDRRHERMLSRVETRLTDLGISGRIERLTMFKDIREVVEDAVDRGCETIVAVGNDATVARLIDVIGDFDAAFGLIPIGDGPHRVADMLGIPADVEACNILSRRVVQTIDLGRINDHYFLTSVDIPRTRATMTCNSKYDVIPTEDTEVRICNLAHVLAAEEGEGPVSVPRDGFLETVIRPAPRNFFSKLFRRPEEESKPTIVPVRTITLRHHSPFTVIRDGLKLSSNSLKIEILPKKLKVVTGKERKFE